MPRASWRGHLRLSLVSCPIYLSPATARTRPIRLHQVWRATPAEQADDELPDQARGPDLPDVLAPKRAPDEVEDRVRRRIRETAGLEIDRIVVTPPGTIPRTTSGKVRRAETRARLEAGTLGAPIGMVRS